MYKLVKRTICLFLLLAAVSWAQAQDAKRISVQEAIDLGIKNSKQLQVSLAKADGLKAKHDQQVFAIIPNLGISSSYTRISDNIEPFKIAFPGGEKILNPQILNNYNNRASISQTLFAGMRGFYLMRSTKYMEEAGRLDYENNKTEVRINIINAYYNYYKAIQNKKVIEDNMKVLEKRLYDTKNFQSVGMALPNDVLKVELVISQQQQALAELESAIEVSNYNLDIMLGLPVSTTILPDESSLFSAHDAESSSTYQSKAIQNRFDLKAADMRVRAAYNMVRSSRGGFFPTVAAGFNFYLNRPNQRVFPQEQKFKDTWDLGVSLNWNLATIFTNRYNVREAKANLAQATAIKEGSAEGAQMEVNANYQAYALSLKKIDLCKKAREQAIENQRVLKNQYDNNVKVLSDLLDADFLLLQSELNLRNANIDAETAYQKLLKASGNF